MDYEVRMGDQYLIPFPVIAGNKILSPNEIEDVIISFNDLCKSYKDGDVTFNWDRYFYEFPLLQEETLDLYPGMRLNSQVRYKLKKLDDKIPMISSCEGPSIVIVDSNSKEII